MNSLAEDLNVTPVREKSRGEDADVESVSHLDFLRDPEVLMRLRARVSKRGG